MTQTTDWNCLICGERVDAAMRFCWKCGSQPDGSKGIEVKKDEIPKEIPAYAKLSVSNAVILLILFTTFFIYFAWRQTSILVPALCLVGVAYSCIHIVAWTLNRGVNKIRNDNLEEPW